MNEIVLYTCQSLAIVFGGWDGGMVCRRMQRVGATDQIVGMGCEEHVHSERLAST